MDIASQSTQATSPYNTTGINDEEYNALYAEALKTVDESTRNELTQRMRAIEFERGGYIVWGWEDSLDAVAPSVQGLESGTKSTGSLNNFALERVSLA
jgi:peptide/nickel transport system substrate-binding protein